MSKLHFRIHSRDLKVATTVYPRKGICSKKQEAYFLIGQLRTNFKPSRRRRL